MGIKSIQFSEIMKMNFARQHEWLRLGDYSFLIKKLCSSSLENKNQLTVLLVVVTLLNNALIHDAGVVLDFAIDAFAREEKEFNKIIEEGDIFRSRFTDILVPIFCHNTNNFNAAQVKLGNKVYQQMLTTMMDWVGGGEEVEGVKNIENETAVNNNASHLFCCLTMNLSNKVEDGFEKLICTAAEKAGTTRTTCLRMIDNLLIQFRNQGSSNENEKALKCSVSNKAANDPPIQNTILKHEPMVQYCSYTISGGMHVDQHWYNCYSCGLTSDEGCCLVCAQTCHEGHDVAYARKSSFYCDCGAQGSTKKNIILRCKSLKVKFNWAAKLHDLYTNFYKIATTGKTQPNTEGNLVVTKLRGYSIGSVEDVILGSEAENPPICLLNAKKLGNLEIISSAAIGLEGFLPVCASKRDLIKISSSESSNQDRIKKAGLKTRGISRNAVVFDSRGRCIIGEFDSLLFTSAFPIVNAQRNYQDSKINSALDFERTDGVIEKASASFTKSKLTWNNGTPFHIVGLKLNPSNERHLLVHGISKCFVVVLYPTLSKVESHLEVNLDFVESDSTEYVIGVEWVADSESQFVVTCSNVVKIYDANFVILGEVKKQCNPLTNFIMSSGGKIRDCCLVPTPKNANVFKQTEPAVESGDCDCDECRDERSARRRESDIKSSRWLFTMIVMCEAGKLFSNPVYEENFKVEESQCVIDSSDHLRVPIGGMKKSDSGDKHATFGERVTTNGSGAALLYCKRSDLILYSCASAGVMMLKIDGARHRSFVGGFEILHSELNATNFHELPSTTDGSFRMSFVGSKKCEGAPDAIVPKHIMCVSYSHQNGVSVEELAMPNFAAPRYKAAGVPPAAASAEDTFDGFGCFSIAKLNKKENVLEENLFFSALHSSGVLSFWGEKRSDDQLLCSLAEDGSVKPPMLAFFESVQNVSQHVNYFGQSIADDKTMKNKVRVGTGDYFMSVAREGCAFNIAINEEEDSGGGGGEGGDGVGGAGTKYSIPSFPSSFATDPTGIVVAPLNHDKAIVGIRFYLGLASVEHTPAFLTVMGRKIKITDSGKRWHNIMLSDEEIVAGVRSKSITVGLGPSLLGGNTSIIDAIEVYAKDKTDIFCSLKFSASILSSSSLHAKKKIGTTTATALVTTAAKIENLQAVVLVTRCLVNAAKFVGESNMKDVNVDIESIKIMLKSSVLDSLKQGKLRSCVLELLGVVEKDEKKRKEIIEVTILEGLQLVMQEERKLGWNKLTRHKGGNFDVLVKVAKVLASVVEPVWTNGLLPLRHACLTLLCRTFFAKVRFLEKRNSENCGIESTIYLLAEEIVELLVLKNDCDSGDNTVDDVKLLVEFCKSSFGALGSSTGSRLIHLANIACNENLAGAVRGSCYKCDARGCDTIILKH
ncbi:hypothetical protein ScalyP_jg46, partial [Parmales sp. scaly parma]